MKPLETTLRAIKDRIATAQGTIDEISSKADTREGQRRLADAARELHQCADDIQNILGRIRQR